MFMFFIVFVDVYEKILVLDMVLFEFLEKGSDKSVVLERVLKRVEWEFA